MRRMAQHSENGGCARVLVWQYGALYFNIVISNLSVRAGGPSPMKSVELG